MGMTERTSRSAGADARPRRGGSLFSGYQPLDGVYDEVFESRQTPRAPLAPLVELLEGLGPQEFRLRQRLANGAFLRGGITFSVYSDSRGVEKIFPFDLVPRTVAASDWERVERGLEQRVTALNLFLEDVYGPQHILQEGVVPREIVEGASGYLPQVRGIKPRGGIYVHIAGIDLVRDPSGQFLVLEDNLRCPSGVSYVLENRAVMKRVFPSIFANSRVRPVDGYPTQLRDALETVAPDTSECRTVVLTAGQYNSAYFEHSFLARRMGVDLVMGSDLFVEDDRVFVKTTRGPQPVHVVYRRVDDDFLDPQVFRKDSLLGVPGIMRAYAKGNVTVANALGNGVADDKAIYPFVPDMIRFYLKEDPILGQIETLICARETDRKRVLGALPKMVVKAVDASGGYGMLFGPRATKAQCEEFAGRIAASPRGYIAQPLVELSTCPTYTKGGVVPRRVDLRPYIITGRSTWVLPGGLTRVALVEGSYVVNSSQGGGSKDTWVLEDGVAS